MYAAASAARLAVQRRREEQRLAAGRARADDAVDGGAEAHVEHPVGLVEHECADVGERHRAARHQVLEPARRRHQDLRAPGGADLLLEADPAVHGGNLETAGAQQRPRVLDDLGGELAGRREHERGGARLAPPDAVGERHGERQRLARPGRRLGQHVATGEHVADHEPLDRERPLDALSGEGVHDRGGYAEIGER